MHQATMLDKMHGRTSVLLFLIHQILGTVTQFTPPSTPVAGYGSRSRDNYDALSFVTAVNPFHLSDTGYTDVKNRWHTDKTDWEDDDKKGYTRKNSPSLGPHRQVNVTAGYGHSAKQDQFEKTKASIITRQRYDSEHSWSETPSPRTATSKDSVYGVVNMTRERMARCIQTHQVLTMTASSGSMLFKENFIIGRCTLTFLVPTGHIIHFTFHGPIEDRGDMEVTISDYAADRGSRTFQVMHLMRRKNPVVAFSATNNVTIVFERNEAYFFTRVLITFKAVHRDRYPSVEIQVDSHNAGYIQSPLWDGVSLYPTGLDSWSNLSVPSGHFVVIVFTNLSMKNYAYDDYASCAGDYLKIFQAIGKLQTCWKELCGQRLPVTDMSIHDLHFNFVSNDMNMDHTGFRARFRFHVGRLDKVGEYWNCSQPLWSEIQHYFACNYRQECANGEDEDNCSYIVPACGRERVWLAGSCFQIMGYPASWRKASALCRDKGGRLASLHTHTKWNAVEDMLRQTHSQPVYIGLRAHESKNKMYRKMWQWEDGSTAFFWKTTHCPRNQKKHLCAVLDLFLVAGRTFRKFIDCNRKAHHSRPQNRRPLALCEFQPQNVSRPGVTIPPLRRVWTSRTMYIVCLAGQVSHNFLACDVSNDCQVKFSRGEGYVCVIDLHPAPPTFPCNNGFEQVSYSLVCDHRPDCSDSADENFCVFSDCTGLQCENRKQPACKPSSGTFCSNSFTSAIKSPATVYFRSSGGMYESYISADPICSPTHFECTGTADYYCLPVYLICNGVPDCPNHEDEKSCDSYNCPGFYRCRNSKICLHATHVCDGHYGQCPLDDDELFCKMYCPRNCICYGMSFFCNVSFRAAYFPELRYLKGDGSNMTLEEFAKNQLLIYLSLARCFLKIVQPPCLPNLHTFDFSDNRIVHLSDHSLEKLTNLRELILSGNPFNLHDSHVTLSSVGSLRVLDLSYVTLEHLDPSIFVKLTVLHTLNLSHSGLQKVLGTGFRPLKNLQILDLSSCPLTVFARDMFQDLYKLERLSASNYKLCCPALLPKHFNLGKCLAPPDPVSSCDNLLQSNSYRVGLTLLTMTSLLGNMITFFYRLFLHRRTRSLGFGIFVMYLCVSDFVMGLYLAMIGVADRIFYGTYLWNDVNWRHSLGCGIAGFLSLLSCEVSAFIITLITADRFVVLRFPFSRFHFTPNTAHVASIMGWAIGFTLATIPFTPVGSHWHLYSQTGICIPLPTSSDRFPGHTYSFGVFVILNFILFVFTAVGQGFIYWSVTSNTVTSTDTNKKSKDLMIARRLMSVAVSDFLCWFPVGVLGVLAHGGMPVSSSINVAIAILVIPLNSALNPFLYTVNVIREHRRKVQETRLIALLDRRHQHKQQGQENR